MSPSESWLRGTVLYQIYPLSFSDANSDGCGDLDGIFQHLDHISLLGIDALWLSPFFTSPLKDFGYDIADHRAVDSRMGTLDTFDRLLAELEPSVRAAFIEAINRIRTTAQLYEIEAFRAMREFG